MLTLIRFEMKKMLGRRVALAVNLGVIVMLLGIMALNVLQASANNAAGDLLSGTEAIASTRQRREAKAGVLTVEKITADIAAYQERVFSQIDRAQMAELTDGAAYDLVAATYGPKAPYELCDPYYTFLFRPWHLSGEAPYQTAARITAEDAAAYYDAVANLTQATMDQSLTWAYTPAERAFWTDLQSQVAEPLAYGYAGGWDNIINCFAFLVFPLLAICVTLTPVFAGEYQDGTDAVLLSCRWGRGRLAAAKILAALAYATAYYVAGAAIICGFSLFFYGAGGADLPIQNYELSSPYPLTCAQAALICLGLMYLATLGVAGLTLLMSARTRSTLTVLVADVAIVFITGLIPSGGNAVLAHILSLFPLGFSAFSTLFSSLTDYPLGPAVLDLITVVALVYTLLTAVCTPLAARSFRRHQVA